MTAPKLRSPQTSASDVESHGPDLDDLDDELDDLIDELDDDPVARATFEDATEVIRLLDALRTIREVAGLSQSSVASLMGTQQSAVSVLEGGDSDPQLSTVMRYARALGVRLPLRPVIDNRDTARPRSPWAGVKRPSAVSSEVPQHRAPVVDLAGWSRSAAS